MFGLIRKHRSGTPHSKKAMLEAVAASEATNRAILNNMADGLIILNSKGFIEDVNPATEKMFGHKRKDLIDQNVSILMPEEYQAAHHTKFNENSKNGPADFEARNVEFEGLRKDGTKFPVEFAITCANINGEKKFIGSCKDITERKENEEKLLKANARTEQLYRETPVMLQSTDIKTMKLVNVSDHWLKVMGYTREEVIGTSPFDYIAETEEEINSAKQRALAFHKSGSATEVPQKFRKKNGEVIDTLLSAVIDYEDGVPIRSMVVLKDITLRNIAEAERNEAEEKSKKSAQDLVNALKGMTDGFAYFDRDDKLVIFNAQYINSFPNNMRKMIQVGVSFYDVWKTMAKNQYINIDKCKTEEQFLRLCRTNHRFDVPTEMKLNNGKWFSCEESTTEDGGKISVRSDITARKRREADILAAKKAAELANVSKSDFIANMSHELRTPLNAIIGFSEIMQSKMYGPLDDKYAEYATDINDSGNHLLEIINDILDLAKVEAHRLDINPSKVNVTKLAVSAERFIKERAHTKNIKLVNNVPTDLPELYIDETRIKQVLINLMTNAVKFTPEGGTVTLATKVGKFFEFSVTDTGIGMDKKGIEKALEKFGQVENAYIRTEVGTGLGLPLSVELVKLHGGDLKIKSKLGEGTTVTIRLIRTDDAVCDLKRKKKD